MKRNHKVYVVTQVTGYPINVYAGTPSGLKRAQKRMLELAESWRELDIRDEPPEVRLFALVQIENVVVP